MNEKIKTKVKEWVGWVNPKSFTVGDIQMFALDFIATGKEVEKCVFSLAKGGFLNYSLSKSVNALGLPTKTFIRNPVNTRGRK